MEAERFPERSGLGPVFVDLMDVVRDVCSTWRAPLFLGRRQPVGLAAVDGRVPPPECHGAKGAAICVCCESLPSHSSGRRADTEIEWL